MRSSLTIAGAVLCGLLAPSAARAQGASGELRCSMAGGFGLFVASDRKVTCVYYRPDGRVEFYVGSSGRVGVDVGPTNAVRIAYRVLTPGPTTPGALDGDFGGVGIDVTMGAGVGADVLAGGPGGSIKLLPIKNVNLAGLNVNAGIGLLHLRYAGMEPSRR